MGDFEFKNLYVSVTRSLVDQHVGPVKTEASRKLMPIDEYVAHDLLAWYDLTPYKKASDYVWATCDLSTRCSFFVAENQKHSLFLFFLCRRRFHVVVVFLRSQGLAAQAVEGSCCPKP